MSAALEGKRALVTAGASGIGRVIAETLVEAGARCMVCDIDAAALAGYAQRFGAGLAAQADVADEARVDALFAQLDARLGGLDILVEGPRVERVMREKAEAAGLSYEDLRKRALQRISLRRGVTAEDVAALVLFLVGEGGRNLSGQAIALDADQTSLG